MTLLSSKFQYHAISKKMTESQLKYNWQKSRKRAVARRKRSPKRRRKRRRMTTKERRSHHPCLLTRRVT
jgi:hypothetical protein